MAMKKARPDARLRDFKDDSVGEGPGSVGRAARAGWLMMQGGAPARLQGRLRGCVPALPLPPSLLRAMASGAGSQAGRLPRARAPACRAHRRLAPCRAPPRGPAVYVEGARPWELDAQVDIAFPCATQVRRLAAV